MNESRTVRLMKKMRWFATGVYLLQTGGCDFNEFIQTVFLGITAAGSLAILDNI